SARAPRLISIARLERGEESMAGTSSISGLISNLQSGQGTTAVSGLISGLQTDSIISQMMQLEQKGIQQYQTQQDTLKAQLAAYQEANTRLAAVGDAAGQLASSFLFDSRTAASSNTAVLNA